MSQSVEDLIASYMSQSPLAFTTMAIATGEEEKKDYNAPKNAEQQYGDPACNYPCCSEYGCCATTGQHVALLVGVVVCCACCCYVTNGFNGIWTYWPF
ncbi:MAG: hypothetical protein MJZ68_01210 [archaeon]|nr:hypothetical protein [archaeon]